MSSQPNLPFKIPRHRFLYSPAWKVNNLFLSSMYGLKSVTGISPSRYKSSNKSLLTDANAGFCLRLLTFCGLDVVAFPTDRLHLQQLHGPVQQAMDHLEAWSLVVVNGTETSAVPRSDICLVSPKTAQQ